MKIKKLYISSLLLAASLIGTTGCDDFLNRDLQGSSDEGQTINPENVDNLVIAAYAHMVSGEDMNSPFSLWPLRQCPCGRRLQRRSELRRRLSFPLSGDSHRHDYRQLGF